MSEPATPARSRRPPPSRWLTIAELTLLKARAELLAAADTGPSGRAIGEHLAAAVAEIDTALTLMAARPIEKPSSIW